MRVRTVEEAVVRLDLTENAAKRRCLEKEATPGVQAMAQRSKKYDRQLRSAEEFSQKRGENFSLGPVKPDRRLTG
ncbi:hypothetical protein AXG93_1175s1020 [Marchantia polymorpha subsp. ruderalis]|uniref:Uncharacterized protein n=1 Tax=Marchantia polymorpha subsp. ruderalis TaxID=1480154 RepID=A0A176VNX1_MARPO|nr:hypothetical protein AXG93_1175s1020 [Marchantia polymorpha subsp. ruderalis]